MKIALVHDYLYIYGGAERVLEALHQAWPQAVVYTAWVDWQWLKTKKSDWLKWDIKTSWFDKLPFKKQLCSPLRFLAPQIWSSFDLADFDLVISSSAWYMSKGVSLSKKKQKNNPLHICYCHTPPRYLYGYKTALNFKKYWWGRLYANLVNPFMRSYDFKSSQAVDWFICNSQEVQTRIKKFYKKEAKIIYPPVLDRINKKKRKDKGYFLMVNRLVRPKNIDLAIRACKKLKLALKIVGSGPNEKRLKKIANNSPYISFLGFVTDKKLAELYLNCKAVFYLAEQEDFGIIPVEAASFGKPVIALRSGGIKESVIEGKTGLFINKLKVEELVKTIKSLKVEEFAYNDFINQAEKFSKARFKKEILRFVEEKIK